MTARQGVARRSLATPDLAFLLQAMVWTVALFGVIRLPWVNAHIVGSLVTFQTTLVSWYGLAAPTNLLVTADCSGADVAAICLGVTLAYPVRWARRLVGALIGLALVIAVNTIRLASLYAVAASPARLNALHLYVWPTLLSLVVVGYVVVWARWNSSPGFHAHRGWLRFCRVSLPALAVYAGAAPWVFASAGVARACTWTAETGRVILGALGAHAQTAGPALITQRGSFVVTPECLYTAMIPLFAGAVFAAPISSRRRWLWLASAPVLFFALGVARVLALALPAFIVERPAILVHGFYQLVAAVALIVLAAHYARRGDPAAAPTRRTITSLAVALGAAILIGTPWRLAIEWLARTPIRFTDEQSALALLPAYQLALLSGLWMALTGGRARRRDGWTLGALAASQVLLAIGLHAYETWAGHPAHALVIRGFAIAVPALLAGAWVKAPPIASMLPVPNRFSAGIEYVIDAQGCDPDRLRSLAHVRGLTDAALQSLRLRALAPPFWHVAPDGGGLIGITLLSESHLSVHTYPAEGLAVINLYCCRPRADWPWEARVTAALGASRVSVRVVQRGEHEPPPRAAG